MMYIFMEWAREQYAFCLTQELKCFLRPGATVWLKGVKKIIMPSKKAVKRAVYLLVFYIKTIFMCISGTNQELRHKTRQSVQHLIERSTFSSSEDNIS